MDKKCPNCGALLPQEASFCPHCTHSFSHRTVTPVPRRIPARALRTITFFVIIATILISIYLSVRPKTYDGVGEVIYTDADGSYQLLLSDSMDRYTPLSQKEQYVSEGESYEFPLNLYVTHKETGILDTTFFLKKIENATVHVEQPSDSPSPVTCSILYSITFNPSAALVNFINFTSKSSNPVQIVWTIYMKNGDTIFLRTTLSINPVTTHNYTSEDVDMSDTAALQVLLDQLSTQIAESDVINIYLPPLTYTEPLIIRGHSFHIIGTEANGQHTTFTAGIQIDKNFLGSTYVTDIDFIGDGKSVGFSSSGTAWLKSCRFSNWKTAALCLGNTWLSTIDCEFENNEIGLHYNSKDILQCDYHFTGNQFTENGTAVLLENVSTDIKMDFSDCVFSKNATDIHNLCNQSINLSTAIFK